MKRTMSAMSRSARVQDSPSRTSTLTKRYMLSGLPVNIQCDESEIEHVYGVRVFVRCTHDVVLRLNVAWDKTARVQELKSLYL